jgi:pimeloyl-ACP methyl ester carboxylesterase
MSVLRGIIMRKSITFVIAIGFALLLLAGGCYEQGGPIPEGAHAPVARDYTQADVDSIVTMQEQVISAPLPAEWGAPAECDEIHFLRFRPSDGSTLDPNNNAQANASTTDAMLVMLPGVLEGANGFEYLARQLIYQAKVNDNKNYEVWAVERRNNRLEDLTGINYIEDQLSKGLITMDEAAEVYINYYYKGQSLNGKTFAGWYANQQLPFLSEFGLKLDTEDVFKVIQTLVPDPEVRRSKVFVGGHSMGGPMAAYFVGWDLDGNPATSDDAGYNNCAGMFGLDTQLGPMASSGGSIFGSTSPVDTEADYAALLEKLRNGTTNVVLDTPPILGAEVMDLLEVIALGAYYDPDTENNWARHIPWSGDVQMILQAMNSRDMDTAIRGVPDIKDFRYTNEALLGIVFDDSFAPLMMIQNSMGFLQGGAVVAKDFPLWPASLISGLSGMFGTGPYWIANDAGPAENMGSGPLYSWANFDEIGDASDPDYQDTTGTTTYTTMENEVADIHDVARVIFKGPVNLVEWYFSQRLLTDFSASTKSFAPNFGLNYLYADKLATMPQVLFLADHGTHADDNPAPGQTYYCKGYNHMDVLTACANASSRRPSEIIRPLIDFLKETAK